MKKIFRAIVWFVMVFSALEVQAMESLSKTSSSLPPPNGQMPLAIFHAFDLTTEEIIKLLPTLKEIGYSHIQLMPSQISRETVPYTDLRGSYLCQDGGRKNKGAVPDNT